jgi:L-threonylcarbamoyladenylate synthase
LVQIVKADLEGLVLAADMVARGGVICYPTDTVYGLGCDPLNPSAVEKVIAAKGRGMKAMPVLVKSADDAERLAYFSEPAKRLVDRYWPGPLTIVLPAKDPVPAILAPQRTVGVRSPRHVICQQLLGLCSGYLVGTSANLTGKSPAVSVEEIVNQLGDRVDLILDGGRIPTGVPSTVVDLTKRRLLIVREGPIASAEILRCLKRKSG